MMTKFSSTTALALFVAAASQASVSAQWDSVFQMQDGQFASCPNPNDFFQGLQLGVVPEAFCTKYPGQPLNASATDVPVSDDPGLDGWSCYPEGQAECPAGYAISEMCVSINNSFAPSCASYCTTPGYFAMKCVPNPRTNVPLNAGEWLPIRPEGNGICDDGSVMCGFCYSANPSDCQGEYWRSKCCKCPNMILPLLASCCFLETFLPNAANAARPSFLFPFPTHSHLVISLLSSHC
jgi:hypothetical protein